MSLRRLCLCAGAWLWCSGSAQAYCRTHTADPAASSCPELCHEAGLPTQWTTPHLSYAFNQRGFPNIADADLRRMIAESFGAWAAVRCAGVSVGIDATAEAEPTPLELGPQDDEPNANVIVYFEPEAWEENSLGNRAYATTQVWFVPSTGEILGADMMFNGNMAPFGECPDEGCTEEEPRADVRNVATHEFGHFLGLAHTNVPGATMLCSADDREIVKRSLAQDDIDGLCAIYPPGQSFKPLRESPSDGCGVASHGDASWLSIGLLLRRRLRRPARKKGASP